MEKTENFEEFLTTWEALPRTNHKFLPSKNDCNPVTLGPLLPQTALFQYEGKFRLTIQFIGTEMERLSGMAETGANYYDLITDELKPLMHQYHKAIFGVPCGAYVGDVITTRSGSTYLFETMQFPITDENGEVRYLLAYGYGRNPADEPDNRDVSDRTGKHIRDLHYMDLGAGAPSNCIINFEPRP